MAASPARDEQLHLSLQPVARPLDLIPVGLKEAALDSPTFRAITLHFADQIEVIERWLEGYAKAASYLVTQVSSLEKTVNEFLSQSVPPNAISEAVLDHDYTMLAMNRYGEGAREFWNGTLRGAKKYESVIIEPIRTFLGGELREFKDARRVLDASQKAFDSVLARYLSQTKTKEASSLREDAFQVFEARKAYLKASMDFCVAAPQLRASLDKLVVKIFVDQWRELRANREGNASMFAKWNAEVDRVRGWSREMENSERAFKRELLAARGQIEESASAMKKPSRELDDYAASTVPYLGTGASTTLGGSSETESKTPERSEKQSWLFLKTTVGKAPPRTVWSRRWFFVKNGIFGWLIQGQRSGGVEESEKIGVLLCSVRPAFQEERRFCFEVKTKDTSIVLQAETQTELTEWISAFEMAKRKALEDPASTESPVESAGVDPAFSISPPVAPELAAKIGDQHASEEAAPLAVPGERDNHGVPLASRASFDVTSSMMPSARRVMSLDKSEGDISGGREHASRIIQKLDLHKRGAPSPRLTGQDLMPAGGIASLISASHNILPVGPGALSAQQAGGTEGTPSLRGNSFVPASTLAPSTLANPPASTNLSHTAVVVSGERSLGLSRGADGSGMPSVIMANLWGSSNWGYVNRLGDDFKKDNKNEQASLHATSPGRRAVSISHDDSEIIRTTSETRKEIAQLTSGVPGGGRNILNTAIDDTVTGSSNAPPIDDSKQFPDYYPLALKAQQAQFRMLFPSVPRSEKLVLVFRAMWNPNEQQEFPGRVYVTPKDIYFYSNHLGLVLITGVSLSSISEVTAAPGRDCDFLYIHLKEGRHQEGHQRRITIKAFLEQLRLLQRRLNFLVRNANADDRASFEDVLQTLIKMEFEEPKRSSSVESWEDVVFDPRDSSPPANSEVPQRTSHRRERDVKASLRIDGSLYGDPARTGREVQKFKLPAHPVNYAPQGMRAVSVMREFNVSAKALFHVVFGDKSAVFQLLYCNRWAATIVQTPWSKTSSANSNSSFWTRAFSRQDKAAPLAATQTIDVMNDHLCYVVTNSSYPWLLPYGSRFTLVTKIVITHTAKSKCKLAVYQQICWRVPPLWSYIKHLIEQQALSMLEADALDLSNVAMDQVSKLGAHSKTNHAIEIFGNIGQQTQVPHLDTSAVPTVSGGVLSQRLKQKKVFGLIGLVVNDVVAKLFATLGWLLDVIIALGKGILNICTAHTFLVGLLTASVLYNGWYGYRDTMSWWHERSAISFMGRIGVRPEPVSRKAIYLSNIEELVAAPSIEFVYDWQGNSTQSAGTASLGEAETCRTTFLEQLNASSSLPLIRTGNNGPIARLSRTRESLARHRHDLLVALRIVNRVEKDVVASEWEEWVNGEERKCARVEGMLKGARDTKGEGLGENEDLDAELGDEFAEYCRSCRDELIRLGDGNRMGLS